MPEILNNIFLFFFLVNLRHTDLFYKHSSANANIIKSYTVLNGLLQSRQLSEWLDVTLGFTQIPERYFLHEI